MLDRETLQALARHPERNDAALNVALAEEGDILVLRALVESQGVGPDALAVVAARVAAEGERVGYADVDVEGEAAGRRSARQGAEEDIANGTELDRHLVSHPRSDDAVRDAVLSRHASEPFFVLAAARHERATRAALERAARWPASTPLHDRPWLRRIVPHAIAPLLLDEWTADPDSLLREAAATIARDGTRLAALSRDPSRRVRRAVVSNPASGAAGLRQMLAESDPACEVRARAASMLGGAPAGDSSSDDVIAMESGGVLELDVARAVRTGPLDVEGARLAARALDDASVGSLIASRPLGDEIGVALAAGIALRHAMVQGPDDEEQDDDVLLARCVRALAGADRSGGVVTGKNRLSAWLAEGIAAMLARQPASEMGGVDGGALLGEVAEALGRLSLAADRMVLGRVAAARGGAEHVVADLAALLAASDAEVPVALIELAWRDRAVPDDVLGRLAGRVRPAHKGSSLEASPENDVDLDPLSRPLASLEAVGARIVGRAPLSPRAALALVALEPRRVRYVLSALPQWRGVLSGAHIARVLRAHAGALSAAGPSSVRRSSTGSASWTQRRLDEAELAVALAIGDLAPGDVAARIAAGQDLVEAGTALAAAMEARAALAGAQPLEPLVEMLSTGRRQDAALLAAWLVVEPLDRPRSAAALAAALDAPWTTTSRASTRTGQGAATARSMVAPGLSEALATLERRSPGRLAHVIPQTPRGRAALVSGLARAYRALGGMSVSEGREP